MTQLFIGPRERKNLEDLRQRANDRPVDYRAVLEGQRDPEFVRQHIARMDEQTIRVPMRYTVTFTIETGRPNGTMRHMSMRTSTKGKVPSPEALWMVAQELGFVGELSACEQWLEDILGGEKAVNVGQYLDPVEANDHA